MIELIGTISTVFAIAGVLLNNRRLRLCFLLWMVSNAISLIIHFNTGVYSLVIRDGIFFILAIEGWIKWGENLCESAKSAVETKP